MFCNDVQPFVVRHSLWQFFFNSLFNLAISFTNSSKISLATVTLEGGKNFGYKTWQNCLNPSPSAALNGISSKTTILANNFLQASLLYPIANKLLLPLPVSLLIEKLYNFCLLSSTLKRYLLHYFFKCTHKLLVLHVLVLQA